MTMQDPIASSTPRTDLERGASSSEVVHGLPACDGALTALLRPLRRRQRALHASRGAAFGLFAGLVAAAALLCIAWVLPDSALGAAPSLLVLLCVAAALAGAILGAMVGALARVSDLHLARALDRASRSEDRFASALQLAGHHRRDRAGLIARDAVARVATTAPAAALPFTWPRAARWSAVPLATVCLLLVLLPARVGIEAATPAPEVSSEEWAQLHEEFAEELENLPKPETPEEEEMRKLLEELSAMLRENPEKKDVLTEIARLGEKIERERQSLSTRDLNMRSAANAIARSEALKQFASTLKQGDYDKAASELDRLAEQMDSGEVSPDAREFESMSADLEKLAKELSAHREMQQSAQDCAKCAGSMNKNQMSQSLKRLAQQLRSNSKSMCKGDSCRRSANLLDLLRRRLGQCNGNGNGNGQCNGLMPGNGTGKGGLKAGWGSAANWEGGELGKSGEGRVPDMVDDVERSGEQASFKIVSADERVDAGKTYEELYAEFVQKTEADLDLDHVPVAYREYLRKYFNSIRPQEPSADSPAPGRPTP